MKYTAIVIASVASLTAGQQCFKKGACSEGFMDKTNGKGHWWACGNKCSGGRRQWTDGSCNCACTPTQGKCNADGSVKKLCTLKRGQCNKGFVDITNGKGNWWACGNKCSNGRRTFTDGSCNCACQPAEKYGCSSSDEE